MSLGNGMSTATKDTFQSRNITKANILKFFSGTAKDEKYARKFFGITSTMDGNVQMDRYGQRYDKLFRSLLRAGKLAKHGNHYAATGRSSRREVTLQDMGV